jgi:hypothetical protein
MTFEPLEAGFENSDLQAGMEDEAAQSLDV